MSEIVFCAEAKFEGDKAKMHDFFTKTYKNCKFKTTRFFTLKQKDDT